MVQTTKWSNGEPTTIINIAIVYNQLAWWMHIHLPTGDGVCVTCPFIIQINCGTQINIWKKWISFKKIAKTKMKSKYFRGRLWSNMQITAIILSPLISLGLSMGQANSASILAITIMKMAFGMFSKCNITDKVITDNVTTIRRTMAPFWLS